MEKSEEDVERSGVEGKGEGRRRRGLGRTPVSFLLNRGETGAGA